MDLGCGVDALTKSLTKNSPTSIIVGVDKSKCLLRHFQRKGIASAILAEIPNLPFKEDVFDVAIAIQVLHEIVSLKDINALIRTLKNIRNSLGEVEDLSCLITSVQSINLLQSEFLMRG